MEIFTSFISFEYNSLIETCGDMDSRFSVLRYQETKVENKIKFLDAIKKEDNECFKAFNIDWFPPYMTKVDKIDYTQFPEDIRAGIKALDTGKKNIEEVEAVLKNNH